MDLQGKSALVTGGASGLGAATVRALVEAGAYVVIADIDENQGVALAYDVGPQTFYVKTDVTDEVGVQAALQAAAESAPLVAVVNCAGIGVAERLLSREGVHRLDSFRRTVEVNLIGTFNVLRLAAALMAENEPDEGGERGVIINTASIAAFEGQIGQIAYSASKGGVVSLTLPAARDLATKGVRVVTIAPGLFDTPMLRQLPESVRQALAEHIPFPRRLGKPEEYALLVRHIIANPMLNGCVIRLDGALRMPPR